MSKKLILGIVIAAVLIGGGIGFVIVSNEDGESDQSNQTNTTQQSADGTTFNPVATDGLEFAATLTTTTPENVSVTATIQYDTSSKAWQYTATNDGETLEAIYTADAYYIKSGETWLKLPLSQGAQTFNPDQYDYSGSTLSDLQAKVASQGTAACPAGTCHVWKVEGYEGNSAVTIYVDTATNRISQVVAESAAGTSTIVYDYKDVTVTIPTEVSTVPIP